uniref:Uncharacterized protein n=1 Tax=viral metagenome TaxID=1070528 RepID=A0A6M3JHT1_9ZZZZ
MNQKATGIDGILRGGGFAVSALILVDMLETSQMKGIYVGDTGYLCVKWVAVFNARKKDISC